MKSPGVYIFNRVNSFRRSMARRKRPSGEANKHLLEQRGENTDSFIIRDATEADIPALAGLHVKTWNETYRSTYKPSLQLREQQWREQFNNQDGSWFCLLVENNKGDLAGYARGRRYADEHTKNNSGELNKIYLLRDYQRLGLGRRLFASVVHRFRSMGINEMVLYGTPQNPSCYFHEAMGGERLWSDKGAFHGGYIWKDLEKTVLTTRV